MNKKYLIGIYKIFKQNSYLVAVVHALYSYVNPWKAKVYALFSGYAYSMIMKCGEFLPIC